MRTVYRRGSARRKKDHPFYLKSKGKEKKRQKFEKRKKEPEWGKRSGFALPFLKKSKAWSARPGGGFGREKEGVTVQRKNERKRPANGSDIAVCKKGVGGS